MFSGANTREVADVEVDSVDTTLPPTTSRDGETEAARADTRECVDADENGPFSSLSCEFCAGIDTGEVADVEVAVGAGEGALPLTAWPNGPSEALTADVNEGRDASNV